TVAKLTDAKSRVRLGQLVPADLLVFIDSVPKLPKPASRIQVSESKSGIVLGSQIFDNDALLEKPQAVLDLVAAALAKRAVPTEQRHILGYLDFRSEESGLMLDGLAAALGTLVVTDLARAPHIVVLEREHLQYLQMEKELTKLEQDLRASVRLLEGGIRRTADTNVLAATVSLRPLAGGEPLLVKLIVPAADAMAAEKLIADKVAGLLKAKRAEWPTVDRSKEAEVFAKQADLWIRWGDKRRAVHAAETAYALDSSQNNRLLLANILVHGEPSLRESVRANQTLLDYDRLRIHAISAGTETNLYLPTLGYRAQPASPTDSAETRELRKELARLEDTLFRCQLDHYRQHYDQAGEAYWETWTRRLDRLDVCFPGEPTRQAALVREAAEAFTHPPSRPDWIPYQRLQMFSQLPYQMGQQTVRDREGRWLNVEPLPHEIFYQLLQELTRHADPYVRLLAQLGLDDMLSFGTTPEQKEERIAARLAAYKVLLDDIPPTHPYRQVRVRGNPSYMGEYILLCALSPIGFWEESTPARAIEKEMDYRRQLLEAVIRSGEPERFGAWRSASSTHLAWLDQMARRGRTADALALTAKILELCKPDPPPELVEMRERLERLLKGEPPQAQPAAAGAAAGWEDYEIQRLNFRFEFASPATFGRSVVFTLSEGNRLYCLHPISDGTDYDANVDFELATHWLPSGSPIGRVGVSTGLSAPAATGGNRRRAAIHAATLASGKIYVGTSIGLASLTLDTKAWQLITQKEGLPGTTVRAVGWYRGRLYLGIGCDPLDGSGDDQSVFAAYDPQSKHFEIIASEKSVGKENPWNGVRFLLDDIVPDEPHDCLWLKQRQGGVWKFMPTTRRFEQVVPAGQRVMLPGSRYVGQAPDIVHESDAGWPVTLFLPPDQTELELPGGINGIPVVHQSYLAARDADAVIASTRKSPAHGQNCFLFLIKRGKAPAVLGSTPDGQPFPDIIHLYESPAGIVAVTASGDGFLIRRKAKAQVYRQAELQAASGDERETKLLTAAADGRSHDIEQLLSAGANINTVDRRGWTPLHYAIEQKHTETALLLIRKGADIRKLTESECSPLTFAAQENDVALIKELLMRHVPVEPVTVNGTTPLIIAAAHGSVEAAELLIAAGADVNRRRSVGSHDTVLMTAASEGQLGAVTLLLAHGAKLEETDQNGNTAMMYAAAQGHVEILKCLRERGANIDAINRRGGTVLMHAVYRNRLEAVRFLLEAGADVNQARSGGYTVLMDAAQSSTPEIVQLLIDHGANVNAAAEYNRTAMSLASYKNRLEIINILRKAGATDPQEKKP
ncbi:MAG: ankyrin repeat domain-containing protein, partial [Acidobacteria bacterium]|nr:ankyrin repeat domain-containing protein [Acidobacteriota bacterium]